MIYLSYVLGDATQRANGRILSRDEIIARMQYVKELQVNFIRVTRPEHRTAYDAFVLRTRLFWQNHVQVTSQPHSDDLLE